MTQFHFQIPPSKLFPEEEAVLFNSLDELEDYAEYLLEEIFNGTEEPVQSGLEIFHGVEYVGAVVRMPSTGEVFSFREFAFEI